MSNSNARLIFSVVIFAIGLVCIRSEFFATATAAPEGTATRTNAVASPDEREIRELLTQQAEDWNRGNIDSFMTSYWKSDQTLFVGATGVARGWQAVLARYHRAYPDHNAMGHLTFSNLEVRTYCSDAAMVLGNYHLDRENDHPEGVFTLDLRKFPDGWRIVVDHTTAFPAQAAQTH
jgi:ketosteroid isomerase-like protein